MEAFLDDLVGWEPSLGLMVGGFGFVRAHSEMVRIQPSATRTGTVDWEKELDRACVHETVFMGETHDLLILPDETWTRWGEGAWTRNEGGSQRFGSRAGETVHGLIEGSWGAAPISVRPLPPDRDVVRFGLMGSGGTMEWEVDRATHAVRRIVTRDRGGNLLWTETREIAWSQGRAVVVSRDRKDVRGGVEHERIEWSAPAANLSATRFMEPLP